MAQLLFYIPQLDRGGPDRVFYELIGGVPRDSFEPVLLTNKQAGRFRSDLQGLGISLHSLDVGKRFPMKEFAEFVRSSDAKVVLCTLDSIITATFAKLFYRLDVKVIARPANHVTRNSLELLKKRPLKYSLAWVTSVASLHLARFVVCQSEDIRKDLRRYLISDRSMTVIGNPIQLSPEICQAKTDAPVFKLVTLGRLAPQKGYDILIDAVSRLPSSVLAKIQVEIYGDGPDREALQQQIDERGVAEQISLCGFTDDVKSVLQSAHFFVSSSRYEGFPNAILEALAMGISVIASDCPGGTREIVLPSQTGWLFESENAKDLARCIENALDDGPFAPNSIREVIDQKSSTETIVSKYLQVFQDVSAG